MQFSYSRVDCFNKCPYQFKLRYIDNLIAYDEYEPQDALKLGTALHTAIEKGISTAIQEYYNSYPIISDLHINEAMKLENLAKKAIKLLPDGEHEIKIECEDFKGFIDLLVPVENDVYDIYDFKYSNNVDKYMESAQLHLYKYFFEKCNPDKKIRRLYYLIVPKTMIRQKKTEDLYQFRKRLEETLETMQPHIINVEYDESKVIDFLLNTKHCIECEEYQKNKTKLCDWCEYQAYCENKEELNIMNLPSTQRVEVEKASKKKIWIYGQPFSGKTTFADKAPTPLNLNTDGNVKYVTMPRVPIKDEITTEGRITNRKFAWEVFKDTVSELEKCSDFETIVVDLLEDVYEDARLYIFDKYNIEHESDSGFGKGWDLVRTEFLKELKRLLDLGSDYNIILISHEDTSKDITKKGGDKISSIQPNINEKVAKKVAGMVDIVLRAVEDNGKYTLNFKADEFTFGGGRLQGVKAKEIDSDWDALCAVYDEAIGKTEKPKTAHQQKVEDFKNAHQSTEQVEDEQPTTDTEPEQTEEAPKRRTRRTRA